MKEEFGILLIVTVFAVAGLVYSLHPELLGMAISPMCEDYNARTPQEYSFIIGVDNNGKLFLNWDDCVDKHTLAVYSCMGSTPRTNLVKCGEGRLCYNNSCRAVENVPEEERPGYTPPAVETPKPVGNGPVVIGTPTDLLEIGEPIGSVRETLTDFDLPFLKSGSISTQRGVTRYNQYLQFNETSSDAGAVIFGEDEYDNVGLFLRWVDGAQLFDYQIQFEEGFRSSISGGELRDLVDRTLNILGTDYTVVRTQISDNSTIIELLGGVTRDLGELDEITISQNGQEYTIEVVIVSEIDREVLLSINGQQIPRLRVGETYTTQGLTIGIRDIIPTGKETQPSLVRIYTGGSKIEFKDTDTTDDQFLEGGARVNNEIIEDAAVKILLSRIGGVATLNSITYRLRADAVTGDLNVPQGHGVREYLSEPEGMLAPGWDIYFDGLIETGTTAISLEPTGRDEYKFVFTNQEGLQYNFPLISARQGGGLRFGKFQTQQRNLVFIEGTGSSDFKVQQQDYIVLSNVEDGVVASSPVLSGYPGFSGQSDNTAFTRIMQYQNYDSTNEVLTFVDLAVGTKQVTLSGNEGNLIVGGITYKVFVDPATGNLAVDLDGDGDINSETAVLAVSGGGLLVLGTSNPAGGAVVGATNRMSLTTLAKQFDESAADETIGIEIEARSGNQIGISAVAGITLETLTTNPLISQAVDNYGAGYELYDPQTDLPEELNIEYPGAQRGVAVLIG